MTQTEKQMLQSIVSRYTTLTNLLGALANAARGIHEDYAKFLSAETKEQADNIIKELDIISDAKGDIPTLLEAFDHNDIFFKKFAEVHRAILVGFETVAKRIETDD